MLLRSFEIDFGDTGDDKGGLSNTKWFSHENGLNGRTASTTNYRHGKTVIVCPCHMSSKKINQVLMTTKTGMCRSYINQVLSEKISQNNQVNFLIKSSN